jgi:type IV pilus assembly protein PilW
MQHGFGLVELMVAIVVGMLAILVIYQTFAVSEGYRRNTVGASDAQQGGLF